jgi:hypothetical protein
MASDREVPAVAPALTTRLVLRSLAGLGAGLLVAVAAGFWFDIRPAEVARQIAHVSPWAVALCIASSFCVLALQSLRWHRVMAPLLGLRYRDAYKAQIVGVLFNALLPARGGDLLRVQYLGRRTGKNRATILGTEIVDRWLDFWGWIPTFLVFALVANPPSWLFKALAIFGGILLALGIAMLLLMRWGLELAGGARLGGFVQALRTGVRAFGQPRIWVTALLIAPLPWLWEAVVLTYAGRAFGLDLTLVQAFSVMIGFNIATAVPSPGAIGSLETGGVAALVFFGFPQEKALAFMTVYHFSQLLPGMAGGAAVLITEGERLFGRSTAPPVAEVATADLP